MAGAVGIWVFLIIPNRLAGLGCRFLGLISYKNPHISRVGPLWTKPAQGGYIEKTKVLQLDLADLGYCGVRFSGENWRTKPRQETGKKNS